MTDASPLYRFVHFICKSSELFSPTVGSCLIRAAIPFRSEALLVSIYVTEMRMREETTLNWTSFRSYRSKGKYLQRRDVSAVIYVRPNCILFLVKQKSQEPLEIGRRIRQTYPGTPVHSLGVPGLWDPQFLSYNSDDSGHRELVFGILIVIDRIYVQDR